MIEMSGVAYYSISEAAHAAHCLPGTLDRMVHEGTISYAKHNGCYYVPESELMKLFPVTNVKENLVPGFQVKELIQKSGIPIVTIADLMNANRSNFSKRINHGSVTEDEYERIAEVIDEYKRNMEYKVDTKKYLEDVLSEENYEAVELLATASGKSPAEYVDLIVGKFCEDKKEAVSMLKSVSEI